MLVYDVSGMHPLAQNTRQTTSYTDGTATSVDMNTVLTLLILFFVGVAIIVVLAFLFYYMNYTIISFRQLAIHVSGPFSFASPGYPEFAFIVYAPTCTNKKKRLILF